MGRRNLHCAVHWMLYLQTHLQTISFNVHECEPPRVKRTRSSFCFFLFKAVVLKQSDPDDMHTLEAVRFFSQREERQQMRDMAWRCLCQLMNRLACVRSVSVMFFLRLFDMEKILTCRDDAQTKSAGLCSQEQSLILDVLRLLLQSDQIPHRFPASC